MTLRVGFSQAATGLFVFTALGAAAPGIAQAQAPADPGARVVTDADYARAERFLAAAANPLLRLIEGNIRRVWGSQTAERS